MLTTILVLLVVLWRKGPVRYAPATAAPFMWQDGELHWHDEPVPEVAEVVEVPEPRPAEPDLTDITGDHDRFEALADQVFGPQEHQGEPLPPPAPPWPASPASPSQGRPGPPPASG